MKKILFSIIIPVWNTPVALIKKSILSVINQTYSNWELLIVDDGSNEETKSKLTQFIGNLRSFNSKIIFLTKDHSGVSESRNLGIKVSSGDYIVFLDSDDWINDNYLEFAHNILSKRNFNFINFNMDINFDDGSAKLYPYYSSRVFNKKDINEELLYDMITPQFSLKKFNHNYFSCRGVNAKVYCSKTIKENMIFFDTKLKIGEDSCFNISFLKKCTSVYFCDQYLYHCFSYSASASRKCRADIFLVRYLLFEKYFEYFDKDDEAFLLCMKRELISFYYNVLSKYICTKLFNGSFFLKRKYIIDKCFNDELLSMVSNNNCDKKFFTIEQRMILFLIKRRSSFGLILLGKLSKI